MARPELRDHVKRRPMDKRKDFLQLFDQIFGFSCAALHFSGSIKSLPGIAKLPVDVTAVFICTTSTIYVIRAFFMRIFISRLAAFHLLLQSLLTFYFLVMAFQTNSSEIIYQKMFQLTVLGFMMTLFSFAVSSSTIPFDAFLRASSFLGLLCSIVVPITLVFGFSVRGGPVGGEVTRIQYQLVGLLLASASVIVATHLILTWPLNCIRKLVVLHVLTCSSAFLGGRASFVSQLFAPVFSTVLLYVRRQGSVSLKPFFMVLFGTFGTASLLFLIFVLFGRYIFVFLRIFEKIHIDMDVRTQLWGMAASHASLFGLGAASFAPTMGLGDLRKWYPHNLVLEVLVEGGLPGFVLFCMLLLTAVLALCLSRHSISDEQLSVTAGFGWIFAAQILTSTDLANRMAWFWLGMMTGTSCRSSTCDER